MTWTTWPWLFLVVVLGAYIEVLGSMAAIHPAIHTIESAKPVGGERMEG